MGYYMGDFYTGDARMRGVRGDPGFFSFLGKAIKGVTSIASSFIPGGSAIGGVAGKVLGRLPAPVRTGAMVAGRAIIRHPVLSAAGAAGAIGAGAEVIHARRGAAARAAMHPGMRRHRRMRVTNPKALRRAIRRTHGFAKLAMRTIHLVHPRKKARFGGFKRARKRAA